ncbi:hypothetical protein [Polaromonas sp. A23]|uniref:hypothetical protein n=1 Tax=Polaromonas sp. A23 TaxID=1944133 RepID=UPI001438F313|nr:hypothetical protein [Polaromonas sp. A23]
MAGLYEGTNERWKTVWCGKPSAKTGAGQSAVSSNSMTDSRGGRRDDFAATTTKHQE